MNIDHRSLRHTLSAFFVVSVTVLVTAGATYSAPAADIVSSRIAVSERHISARSAEKPRPTIDLTDAMDQRTVLLSRSLTASFLAPRGTEPVAMLTIALADHPAWIVFDMDVGEGRAIVSAERIRQYLISYPVEGIPKKTTCTVLSSWTDNDGVERAQTDCIARSGYFYDIALVAGSIKKALETGESTMSYPLTEIPATVLYPEFSGQPLTLLATGHSDFVGSGYGRKANVRKGLNERIHNVVIPAGAEFSFNDTLGIVSTSRGWHMALTIFEGVNLRPAPGGGICQVSTTLYRAALAAGLPILEQKNHSLWVTYYEKYGVGLDATIFPGKQDLRALNNTGGPILIQAYNKGDEAFVHLYGVDDGRSVSLTGPYFSASAPEGFLENGKTIRGNEVGWERIVVLPSGEPNRETIVARYKALPRSLASRWTAVTEEL